MRIATTSTLVMAGTAAGLVAAVVAYQGATSVTATRNESSVVRARPAAAPATDWLPCEAGWSQHGRACVRIQHKVIVKEVPAAVPVYVPAPAPAPAPAARPARASASSGGHDHSEPQEPPHVESGDSQSQPEPGDGQPEPGDD